MAKKKKAGSSGADQTIESSMDELQEIVQSLESGQESLDVSLQKFERGMSLLRSCHQQLEQAASRIEILTGITADGDVRVAPFDGSATHSATGESSGADESDDDEDSATLF